MDAIERFTQSDDSFLSYLHIYKYGEEHCTPGWSYTQRKNNFYLIHYVVDGTGTFFFNGRNYPLQAGQGFLIEPHTIAAYTADLLHPWHYIWIGFNGIMAGKLLSTLQISARHPIFHSVDQEKSITRLNDLVSADISGCQTNFYLLGAFYQFLSTVKSAHRSHHIPSLFEVALEYINTNYLYDLKIEDIADHLCIDRSYLYKLFLDNIQVSPQEYMIALKIDKATELLSGTSESISNICYMSGFHDLAHFSKAFKKRTGLSPTEFRKRRKKEELPSG